MGKGETVLDPGTLRPLLHESIDRLPAEDLAAGHRLLTELEMRSLYERVVEQANEEVSNGRVTEQLVQAAIERHRQEHPYR